MYNSRKVLHSVVDDSWGKQVSYNFVSGNGFYGTDRSVQRANDLRNLSRTLVLTEDKNGTVELFSFWLDFTKSRFCYSEIKKDSFYLPHFKGIYK